MYIFSKSIDRDIYQGLKKDYYKLSAKEDVEIAYLFNNCEELISVDECNPNSLVVFDDCVNSQQQHLIKITLVGGVIKNFLHLLDSVLYES